MASAIPRSHKPTLSSRLGRDGSWKGSTADGWAAIRSSYVDPASFGAHKASSIIRSG